MKICVSVVLMLFSVSAFRSPWINIICCWTVGLKHPQNHVMLFVPCRRLLPISPMR